MTYYEKVKELYQIYAEQNPQLPYDKATECIAEELGMTPQLVLHIVMRGMYQ